MCLVVAFAFLPLRIGFYETFLAFHIVLVVLTLVGCWYHLVPHFGHDFGYEVWLYIAFAFWAADRLARLARLAIYSGLDSSKAVVEAIPGTNVLQITVFPRTSAGFGPGQHSFLYFVGLGKFWESHPFSVAGWSHGNGPSPGSAVSSQLSRAASGTDVGEQEKQTFGVETKARDATLPSDGNSGRASLHFLTRVHTGATAALQRRLHSSASSSSLGESPTHRIEIAVYNEGPYGGHRTTLLPLYTADTVLCLAGGIGITNALGYLQEFAATKSLQHTTRGDSREARRRGMMSRASRFILAWTVREMPLVRHIERNMLADIEGVEYSFWCTGSSAADGDFASPSAHEDQGAAGAKAVAVTAGRMDLRSVIRSAVEPGRRTAVMLCGPGAMADAATNEVVACVKDGFAVQLVVEAFAW